MLWPFLCGELLNRLCFCKTETGSCVSDQVLFMFHLASPCRAMCSILRESYFQETSAQLTSTRQTAITHKMLVSGCLLAREEWRCFGKPHFSPAQTGDAEPGMVDGSLEFRCLRRPAECLSDGRMMGTIPEDYRLSRLPLSSIEPDLGQPASPTACPALEGAGAL